MPRILLAIGCVAAVLLVPPSADAQQPQAARPKVLVESPAATARTGRIIALAEPGQTMHQPFADAALRWLEEMAAKEGFAVDYVRTTDPIDDAYLAAHDASPNSRARGTAVGSGSLRRGIHYLCRSYLVRESFARVTLTADS